MEILRWSRFVMEARDLGQNILRGRVKYPSVLRCIGNNDPSGRKYKGGISSKILGGQILKLLQVGG